MSIAGVQNKQKGEDLFFVFLKIILSRLIEIYRGGGGCSWFHTAWEIKIDIGLQVILVVIKKIGITTNKIKKLKR